MDGRAPRRCSDPSPRGTGEGPAPPETPAHQHPPAAFPQDHLSGAAGRTGSAQREVLGTEVVPPAQQALGRDELQWHRLGPFFLQVLLEYLRGGDRQPVRRPVLHGPHCPAPGPPHSLTWKAVSSRSGAMLTSASDSAWLMALAALDTSGW